MLPLSASIAGVDLALDPTKQPVIYVTMSNVFDKSTLRVNKTHFDNLFSFKDFGPQQLLLLLKVFGSILENIRSADGSALHFQLPFTTTVSHCLPDSWLGSCPASADP